MRRSKKLVSLSLILCAAVLGWPPSGPAAIAGDGSPIVQRCPHAPTVLCGSIRVPLYWKRPSLGGTLTVQFRVYPHTDDSQPALEPLVGIEGGPGYGAIGSASTYLFMMGDLHRRHDLIVMDQRGTGSSGAIDCPALQNGVGPYAKAAAKCARRLGVAAGAYGSAAVGDDLAAILAALHVGTVDVYGDSYGTYAAQVFTLHHPTSYGRWSSTAPTTTASTRSNEKSRSCFVTRGANSVSAPPDAGATSWARSGGSIAGSNRTRSSGSDWTPTAACTTFA